MEVGRVGVLEMGGLMQRGGIAVLPLLGHEILTLNLIVYIILLG